MTKLIERHGAVICAASGREWKHDGSAAGRNAAAAKAAEHQRKYLAERAAPVEHVEDRTPAERRQQILDRQPRQPAGKPSESYDPGAMQWQAEKGRHDPLWEDSPAGRRMKKHCKQLTEQHVAKQQAATDKAAFELSVADLVAHAAAQLDWVNADPDATVADVEQAKARVQLAKEGRRDEYAAGDHAYREKYLSRLAEKAAAVEVQRQTLAEQRDSILAAGLDPPAPVPQVSTPEPAPIVDRSRVAVRRTVQTEHGARVEHTIVDA